MKPLMYSVKEAEATGIGWYRDGHNIAYYQNSRKSKCFVNHKTSYRAGYLGTGNEHYTSPSCSFVNWCLKPTIKWVLWKLLFLIIRC